MYLGCPCLSKKIIVGVSGASGIAYAVKLLEVLCRLYREGVVEQVVLVYTSMADEVSRYEVGESICVLASRLGCIGSLYGDRDWFSPLASSTNVVGYDMVIIPCSMDLVARLAHGVQERLIERIAYNVLRMDGRLVIVPRETPLSTTDLENLLKLSKQGVVVLPASPGFYAKPRTIDDLLLFICGKILDVLGIKHSLDTRWSP